ncbi:type II toxin-antitoxin system RelE/ParE family toxin [Psychroflexus sediminis]|uniref:Plasmid stabilization system protein ParE n=1 Tax=Psychroflexus sediminis TaxID=470826 RepID=A0A1G7ZFY4_9FLAO|nr:type II toxin-antitoxin system RelE/ParE family toxin [Psychroflexus sediminis]SDH07608.1 Plasmid stabilization system protein ParE [Psychroflexus sediminis]
MALKIIWSELAESELDDIYEFYEKIASIKVAKKLVNAIINEPNKLIKTPEIGEKEPFLKHREIEYRYLVFRNYKLIYSVDYKKGCIKIADVFDTRQNPINLNRTK